MPGHMLRVELVDEPAPDDVPAARDGDAPPARPRLGATGRRVALVVAATLVATLVADVAADRTRVADLATVPGILRPVGPGLRPLWEADRETVAALRGGVVVDGALVGVLGDEAPAGLVALDPETGERLWTTPVPRPDESLPERLWSQCSLADELVVCLAEAWGTSVADSWRAVWVVDPADGRIVRTLEPPIRLGAAVVDGLPVTLEWLAPDGGPVRRGDRPVEARLGAVDPAKGARRWTWVSPALPPNDGGLWGAQVTDGGVFVTFGGRAWLVGLDGAAREVAALDEAGRVVGTRTGASAFVPYGARSAGARLRDDGTWAPLPGAPLELTADDGSAPGVELVTTPDDDRPRVAALDGASGTPLWRTDAAATSGVLLDGRLYVGGDDGLVALDARTGDVLWTADPGATPDEVATDGDALLVRHGTTALQAFALADGRPLWRADLVPLYAPGGWSLSARASLDGGTGLVWLERRDGSAVVVG